MMIKRVRAAPAPSSFPPTHTLLFFRFAFPTPPSLLITMAVTMSAKTVSAPRVGAAGECVGGTKAGRGGRARARGENCTGKAK